MRVGVLGHGRVGRSVAELFARTGEVVTWDPEDARPYPDSELRCCDFAVVCVGTPGHADGSADVAEDAQAVLRAPVDRILLKSTVPPGTTDRLSRLAEREICYWPEFIGESAYFNPFFPRDLVDVPFVILGGEPTVRRWFIDRLLPILGPTKRYFQCSAVDAELAKYAENSFFATKISFVNEYRRICDAVGGDWHTVREAWLLDPRVEPMHTAAFADMPGFGGKCLPKDLAAILSVAEDCGYEATLLRAVSEANNRFREGKVALD